MSDLKKAVSEALAVSRTLVLVLLLSTIAGRLCAAPSPPPDTSPRVTLVLRAPNLSVALNRLFRAAGREYRLEGIDGQTGPLSEVFRNDSLNSALKLLLRQVNPPLVFRLEGRTYVISPRQVASPSGGSSSTKGASESAVAKPVAPASPAAASSTSARPDLANVRLKPELVVQTGHPEGVASLAFTADGRQLWSAGKTLKDWQLPEGREVSSQTLGCSDPILSPDGRFIVGRAEAGNLEVTLWEARTGTRLRVFEGLNLRALGLSDDGRFVAGGATPNIGVPEARVWEASTGRLVRRLPGVFSPGALSPDGKWLVGIEKYRSDTVPNNRGSEEPGPTYTATVWDVGTGRVVARHPLKSSRARVICFSSDSRQLVAEDGTDLLLWSPGTAAQIRFRIKGCAYAGRFSPDGQMLAIGEWPSATISFWNPVDGKSLGSLPGRGGTVRALAFSHDGEQIGVGLAPVNRAGVARTNLPKVPLDYLDLRKQTTLTVYHVRSRQAVVRLGVASGVRALAFSPDSSRLLAEEIGNGSRCWDLSLATAPRPVPISDGFTYTADGRTLATHDAQGQPSTWDTGTWQRARSSRDGVLQVTGLKEDSQAVCISPDGKRLVVQGASRLWMTDAASGKLWKDLGPSTFVMEMTFNPDSRILACALDYFDPHHAGVLLWDVATGKPLRSLPRLRDDIAALGCSRNTLSGVTGMGEVVTWDLTSGQELARFKASPAHCTAPTFSADGTRIACADTEGVVRVYSTTGNLQRVLPMGPLRLTSLALSPDGKLLASGGPDGVVRLWSLSDGRELIRLISVGERDYIAATPENYYLASRGGLAGIGFRVGERIFPFDQFDLKLNRPDLVLESLGIAPRTVVNAYRQAYLRRLRQLHLTPELLSDEQHLPDLTVLTPSLAPTTAEETLTLTVRATDPLYRLTLLKVSVNNVPVFGSRGMDLREPPRQTLTLPLTVRLSQGRNKIQLSVLNERGGESLRQTIEIYRTAPASKPALYVLAIGVSEYQDRRFDRLRYAAKDATDITDFFRGSSRPAEAVSRQTSKPARPQRPVLKRSRTRRKGGRTPVIQPKPPAAAESSPPPGSYEQVHLLLLTNQQATRENVLNAREFLAQSGPDDEVVLFCAGHGLVDANLEYYFATTNADPDRLGETALSYEALENLLDGIASRKKLLLIDTCFSGEVDLPLPSLSPSRPGSRGTVRFRSLRSPQPPGTGAVDLEETFSVLPGLFADLRRGCGAQVIAAASGLEAAQEDEQWRNGVFTFAVLEGLRAAGADRDGDGIVRVSELCDYVADRVQELTGGVQRPAARRENLEADFPVY